MLQHDPEFKIPKGSKGSKDSLRGSELTSIDASALEARPRILIGRPGSRGVLSPEPISVKQVSEIPAKKHMVSALGDPKFQTIE